MRFPTIADAAGHIGSAYGVYDPEAGVHVRATKGTEVTPSGWEPGKKVLKPGPDLVGRVWEVWNPKDDA